MWLKLKLRTNTQYRGDTMAKSNKFDFIVVPGARSRRRAAGRAVQALVCDKVSSRKQNLEQKGDANGDFNCSTKQ